MGMIVAKVDFRILIIFVIMYQPTSKEDEEIESQRQSDRDSTELQEVSQFNFLKQGRHLSKNHNTFTSKKKAYLLIFLLLFFFFIVFIGIKLNKKTSSGTKSIQLPPREKEIKPQQQHIPKEAKQKQATQQVKKDEPIQITSPQKKIESSQSKDSLESQSQSTFDVQTKFWLFHSENHKDLLSKLYYQNNQYFSKKSGFDVHIISQANSAQFLSQPSREKLNNLKKILQDRSKGDANLQRELNSILDRMTLLHILTDNGGILLSDYYCLTETFAWLKDLKSNLHAKRGLENVDPEVFAFYNHQRSSPSAKENIKVQYEVDKYMRLFPGLEPYFLVAKKSAKFMVELIDQITQILTNSDAMKTQDGETYTYYGFPQYNVYADYFYLAVHRILQRKQRDLDKQFKDRTYRALAVDYYCLYYINELGSARKFFAMFDDRQNHVQFQSITKQTMEEYTELIGPIRQLIRFTPHDMMNQWLQELIKGKKDPIIKGSMVQTLLYPQSVQNFIIQNPEKPFENKTSEPWSKLNKNVWVYWNNGIENAPLANQLCVQNTRLKAKQSGFELHVVSQSNLKDFLNSTYIDKIQNALKNPKVRTFPQSKPDLVRLALLLAHGGIYFDVSYVLLNNFDWAVNIGRYPSQHVYNRYGNLPKVLMHFHPVWGGVFDWKVNSTINTKVQWQLPYENNFIAAEQGNEFISEWFQLLLSFYQKPYGEVNNYLRSYGLVDMWNSEYLMPMDTLKCVIGRKQKQIRSNPTSPWTDASDYYKIWGLNGYEGFQKYRDRTGYQSHTNPDNNFVYRYSQEYVQGFLGKNFNVIKFYGQQNTHMSNFISNNNANNFTLEAHPQSLFMKYLIHNNTKFIFEGRWKIQH